MPIYDFKCTTCNKDKERITSSAVIEMPCPFCSGTMTRTISGAQSFYFKGVGAYCEKSMNKSPIGK